MKKKYRFDIKLMMADCEANYARICRLLPGVLLEPNTHNTSVQLADAQAACTFAIDLGTEQPAQLSIVIRERCRFTTTVDIQVLVDSISDAFPGIEGGSGCVNMAVRLYHDVNMAEVFACNRKPSRLASYEYPNESMFAPDEKAQQNRFLSEWLGLCLRYGMANTLPLLPVPVIAVGDGDLPQKQDSQTQDSQMQDSQMQDSRKPDSQGLSRSDLDPSDNNYSATAVPPPGNLAAGL